MPQIHPTAIVDPQAEIAPDVVVGPNCIIEGPVTIGPGTRLIAQGFLKGPLHLGRDNTIYPNVFLGYEPQDRKFDPATPGAGLVIGDRNIFREGTSIHRATEEKPTTLGNDNYLMCNSHVGHDVRIGDHCTLSNGALLAGFVDLQDHVMVGGNSAVHQFCRLGRLSLLGGTCGMTQDLPPFCICYRLRCVGSLNLVGLRRGGYREHIEPLKEAFNILYHQNLSNSAILSAMRKQLSDDPLCMELADFVETTERGITPYGAGASDPE